MRTQALICANILKKAQDLCKHTEKGGDVCKHTKKGGDLSKHTEKGEDLCKHTELGGGGEMRKRYLLKQ